MWTRSYRRFGRRTVVFGAMGVAYRDGTREPPAWAMERAHRSPHYTTRWGELPVAQADRAPPAPA